MLSEGQIKSDIQLILDRALKHGKITREDHLDRSQNLKTADLPFGQLLKLKDNLFSSLH